MNSPQKRTAGKDAALVPRLDSRLVRHRVTCVIAGTRTEIRATGTKAHHTLLVSTPDNWPRLLKVLESEAFQEICPCNGSYSSRSRFFLGFEAGTDHWTLLEIVTGLQIEVQGHGLVKLPVLDTDFASRNKAGFNLLPTKAWLLLFSAFDQRAGTRLLDRYTPVYPPSELDPAIHSQEFQAFLELHFPEANSGALSDIVQSAMQFSSRAAESAAEPHAPETQWRLKGPAPVIAFVGPKATGKSTLIRAVESWLSPLLVVKTIHTGKPPSLPKTSIVNLFLPLARLLFPEHRITKVERKLAGPEPVNFSYLYLLRKYFLALERENLIQRAHARAARGLITLADRYPSDQIGGVDGASFSEAMIELQKSRLKISLMRAERRIYDRIPPPSAVINLRVSVETAIHRDLNRDKEDPSDSAYVRFRHETGLQPKFTRCKEFSVQTDQPLADSVSTVKKLVWKCLSENQRLTPPKS